MVGNRRHYDEEFKRRAVRLRYNRDRIVRSAAKALGVGPHLIHRWWKKYTPNGDKTKMSEQNDEIQALYRRAQRGERYPKRTLAYFAKHQC